MKTIISKTHSLVSDGKEGPESTPPNTPVDVSDKTAERLIARGTFREYVEPKSKAAGKEPKPSGPININEADVAELVTIKGVGKKTAGDIVASREADGPFESLEQCADRVGGVSFDQLEAAGATV
jgi:competence ComEA-like helix-hairpin-helix protein